MSGPPGERHCGPPEQGGCWGGGSWGSWNTSLRGRGRVGMVQRSGAHREPGLSAPEEGWARVFWKQPDRFTVDTEIRIAFHFHVSQNILWIFFQPFVSVKTGLGSWTQTLRPTWPCVISGGGQTTGFGRTGATFILFTAVSSHLTQYLEPNSSVQFSHSVVSDSLRPHEPQHTRPHCPSPTLRVHPIPCSSSQ